MNSTQELTWNIKNSIPCIFAKYGDGEYSAATFQDGHNCDGTPLTHNLGVRLRESLQYIVKQPNSMIGKWHTPTVYNFWQSLVDIPIHYVDYHTVINDKECVNNTDKLELFKSIKESSKKKIYIANPLLKRSKILLNIDDHIEVDYSNWFETHYESVRDSVCSSIKSDSNTIIMTSAGIGAKPLIADLHMLFPNAIYIDIGSALDTICTKRDSRGCTPSYSLLCEYYKPIIPPDWESEEYDCIYIEAKNKLGRHLH
jgi:hypothetical protein